MNETPTTSGLDLIRTERASQPFLAGHDDALPHCALRQAARHYHAEPAIRLLHPQTRVPIGWPLPAERWKPHVDDRVIELVKAGSLLLADADVAERAGRHLAAKVLRQRAAAIGSKIDRLKNPLPPEPTAGPAAEGEEIQAKAEEAKS